MRMSMAASRIAGSEGTASPGMGMPDSAGTVVEGRTGAGAGTRASTAAVTEAVASRAIGAG